MSARDRFSILRQAIAAVTVAATLGGAASARAQQTQDPAAAASESLGDTVRELRDEVQQLRAAVGEMRAESARSQAETRQLRRELDALRSSGDARPVVMEAVARTNSANLPLSGSPALAAAILPSEDGIAGAPDEQKKSSRAGALDEEYELLSGKVDDQYQTKVESASKYRMRLSGIVLMNLFSNQGTVDSSDLPSLAYPRPTGGSGGSFGATLRQSELGFEVFGPHVAGARTQADLQVDFAGGFSSVPNGTDFGLMRLRTATMRMDWENTSVIAGQDGLFFAPGSPTSFATLAEPALSYAGNLWGWVPQIRVEHRISVGERSSLLFQGGILDPVSGEAPGVGSYRQSDAGEASRQPAYATRAAWTTEVFGQPLRLGAGGFYSRQDYGFERRVDAWAGMTDVELPLGSRIAVSAKFYRGRGLGGLYGGIGRSVLFSSNDPTNPYTELIGLNSVGGWAQLKYRLAPKIEINAAFGMDNPYARDLKYFLYPYAYGDPSLSRNRSGFANVIYRPRSDVLFSAEYRQIQTDSLVTGGSGAGHLNLMMGVLF